MEPIEAGNLGILFYLFITFTPSRRLTSFLTLDFSNHPPASLLNGTDVVYSWSFGDGTKNESSAPTQKHRYGKKPKGEPYIVALTAKNRAGSLSTLSRVYVQVTEDLDKELTPF